MALAYSTCATLCSQTWASSHKVNQQSPSHHAPSETFLPSLTLGFPWASASSLSQCFLRSICQHWQQIGCWRRSSRMSPLCGLSLMPTGRRHCCPGRKQETDTMMLFRHCFKETGDVPRLPTVHGNFVWLYGRCKEHGVTGQAAISAASMLTMARAQARNHPLPQSILVQAPINMRSQARSFFFFFCFSLSFT